MKAILRSSAVQGVLSAILGTYLALVRRTIRWSYAGDETVKATLTGAGGVIGCLWHGRIALSVALEPYVAQKRPTRLMISLSADGEFIARAMERRGYPSFRGSSAVTRDARRTRQAAAVYRESLDWLAGGGVLVLTPDGPRGPAETMQEGALRLAARTGASVFLMGMAARPALRLKSWDRMMLPLPFGRGAIVFDGPLTAARDLGEPEIHALANEWAARLSRVTRAAEAALA